MAFIIFFININKKKAFGIDLSVEQIKICEEKGLNAKAIALEDVEEKFDCATAIFDVLNYIPNQKASQLAFDSGLVAEGKDWCDIHPKTFESKLVKNVHVIGDASNAAPMPKSAFSASTQGKVVALQIARMLKQQEPLNPPKLANTCYSLVSPTYAISIAAVYEAQEDKIVDLKDLGAGGLSPANAEASFRAQEAQYAVAWYKNQMGDVFL